MSTPTSASTGRKVSAGSRYTAGRPRRCAYTKWRSKLGWPMSTSAAVPAPFVYVSVACGWSRPYSGSGAGRLKVRDANSGSTFLRASGGTSADAPPLVTRTLFHEEPDTTSGTLSDDPELDEPPLHAPSASVTITAAAAPANVRLTRDAGACAARSESPARSR